MTDAQKYRMRLVRAHIDYITAEINYIDKQTAVRNKYFIFLSLFPFFYFPAFYPLLSCKLFVLSTFYGHIMPILKFCG